MTPASLPVRERGLKQQYSDTSAEVQPVAPRAGAWTETLRAQTLRLSKGSHFPKGGVT